MPAVAAAPFFFPNGMNLLDIDKDCPVKHEIILAHFRNLYNKEDMIVGPFSEPCPVVMIITHNDN